MTDEAKQKHEASEGDGRRRMRVKVVRDEPGVPESATGEKSPTEADATSAVGGTATGERAAGGAGGTGGDILDDAAAGAGSDDAAAGAVSDQAEALVAEACIEALAGAEAERDAYLDQLQRLKAEFDNYRKRLQREGEALRLRAAEGLVESLLPVVDNLERALEAAGRHEEHKLVEGVELVSEHLRSVLAGQGLEEVPAEPGVPFDPTVHEAVMAQASDEYPEGTIAAVLEKGYLLHGRLLRPVRVIVAS